MGSEKRDVTLRLIVGGACARPSTELIADIPFAFRAGAMVHPPGPYTLRANDAQMLIEIQPQCGAATVARAETRLWAHGRHGAEGALVFDCVGASYFLSELWAPHDDGYLLRSTKPTHAHAVVKATWVARPRRMQ